MKSGVLGYFRSCLNAAIAVLLLSIPANLKAATSSGNEWLTAGNYRCPVWHSSIFAGGAFPRFYPPCLQVTLHETNGGFDSAVALYFTPVNVDDISGQSYVYAEIIVSLTGGQWYVGPKINVIKTLKYQGLPGNYENYIIENAQRTPKDWDVKLTASTAGGKYIGTSSHDGSTYKHYVLPKDTWTQYYAIRQEYRTKGAVTIKPILQVWRDNGMPNWYISGVRLNIETSGNTAGTFMMKNWYIPSNITVAPDRPYADAAAQTH